MTGTWGTPLERFERKYIPEPNSGCWLWLGATTPKGYGQFYFPPRNMVRAHVVSWELNRGPRNGLCVLHNCDNRCCVNPDHLRLGTQQENVADRELRGRRAPQQGSMNGRATFTEDDVRIIRADPRRPRFIAADWGAPLSTIQNIRHRISWKHVP